MRLPFDSELDRRDFLTSATLASVAAILAACSGSGLTATDITPGPSSITVKLSDFPSLGVVGGIAAVGTVNVSPVAIVRTAQSSYVALSRICTHQTCVIDLVSNGFSCPCHGSRFNSQGNVTQGPATRPLARLSAVISADGTSLTVS
jgi:cytochrome b6-f complex iron-sulfur subunit